VSVLPAYFHRRRDPGRGYQIRSIGPVDSQRRALGGNKFSVHAEYYWDIFGPLRLLASRRRPGVHRRDGCARTSCGISTGFEAGSSMPVLNGLPAHLAYNPTAPTTRSSTSTKSTFKFAVVPPSKETQ